MMLTPSWLLRASRKRGGFSSSRKRPTSVASAMIFAMALQPGYVSLTGSVRDQELLRRKAAYSESGTNWYSRTWPHRHSVQGKRSSASHTSSCGRGYVSRSYPRSR
jgi:hypothetical protein